LTAKLLGIGRTTFASLANPNYRLYFGGQAVSLVGSWMQMIAQSWLVLSITGSSVDLGLVVALQALPVLVLGPYGGVIADRVDKRRLMIVLQSVMGLQALTLGLLTAFGAIQVWQIALLALALGINNAFENPSRQAFMLEMVGPDDLRNAVSLNSVMVNVARTVGPALAGILIATVGDSACFLLNAASFVAVVASLLLLDVSRLDPSPPTPRRSGQLREGLRYVRHTPDLAVPLLMVALVGTLTYEFQVSLPVLAKNALQGSSSTYGFMTASMGIGAVVGGLATAAWGRTGLRALVVAALAFGVTMLAAAFAPSLPLELIVLAAAGAASVSFIAVGNSSLQLRADPTMRGRVMSLWFVAFQGSTPIGGPLVGAIIAVAGARVGLAVGALACLLAAALGAASLAHRRPGSRTRRAAATSQ
jgi:MFS family permease